MTAPSPFPWPIAAPSFVIPAHIEENALFLSGKVREVGLCLFESASCLAYGPHELPRRLADLPLEWHLHLPLDLPWQDGGDTAAEICRALLEKTRHLHPRCAVLHPPAPADREEAPLLLRRFLRQWRRHNGSAPPLLLENTRSCDLTALTDIMAAEGCGVCLDTGHCLGFAQEALAEHAWLLSRVRLVHWSAPGAGDRHLPLTALTPAQHARLCRLARRLPRQARHMLEIFSWPELAASEPVLRTLLRREEAARNGQTIPRRQPEERGEARGPEQKYLASQNVVAGH